MEIRFNELNEIIKVLKKIDNRLNTIENFISNNFKKSNNNTKQVIETGLKLKEFRKKYCLTQSELGRIIHISPAYISLIERGKFYVNDLKEREIRIALNKYENDKKLNDELHKKLIDELDKKFNFPGLDHLVKFVDLDDDE